MQKSKREIPAWDILDEKRIFAKYGVDEFISGKMLEDDRYQYEEIRKIINNEYLTDVQKIKEI